MRMTFDLRVEAMLPRTRHCVVSGLREREAGSIVQHVGVSCKGRHCGDVESSSFKSTMQLPSRATAKLICTSGVRTGMKYEVRSAWRDTRLQRGRCCLAFKLAARQSSLPYRYGTLLSAVTSTSHLRAQQRSNVASAVTCAVAMLGLDNYSSSDEEDRNDRLDRRTQLEVRFEEGLVHRTSCSEG